MPVRIALDPAEVEKHPLQLGLSMHVEVNTHNRDGDRLPKTMRQFPAYQTGAFASLEALAAQRVAAIIAANAGDARAVEPRVTANSKAGTSGNVAPGRATAPAVAR